MILNFGNPDTIFASLIMKNDYTTLFNISNTIVSNTVYLKNTAVILTSFSMKIKSMNRFSKSKIFLLFLLSFIVGLAVRSFLFVSFFYVFGFVILASAGLAVFWPNQKLRIFAFCLIFTAVGILRFNLSLSASPTWPPDLLTKKMEIQGVVYEEPEESDLTRKLKIKIINGPEELIGLKVLVTNNLQPAYYYGDFLKIYGKIQKPEKIEDFDYPAYLSRFRIYLVSYKPVIQLLAEQKGNWFLQTIYAIKRKFADKIEQAIPEPEGSLFAAMVFGIKTKLPPEVATDFSRTGIMHIVAISGQNMTIIAALLMNFALALRLKRKQAFWLASIILVLFTILIGLPASAVRASVMAFLVLWAMSAGRLNRSLNAVVLAAALMLLFNPQLFRYDIGFQLSFLAVLGLIFVAPYFEKIFAWLPDFMEIKSSVSLTLSAQVFSLPVIIYNFKILSLVSPLANVLILPTFSLLLTMGLVGTIISVIFWPLGKLLFWACYFFLKYIIFVCHLLGNQKWGAINIDNFNYLYLLIIYFIIFGLIFAFKYAKK